MNKETEKTMRANIDEIDALGWALFWMPTPIFQAMLKQAKAHRLYLQSHMIEGMSRGTALRNMRKLTTRGILIEQPGKIGGRITFHLRQDVHDWAMRTADAIAKSAR